MTLERKHIYKSEMHRIEAYRRGDFLVELAKRVSKTKLSEDDKKVLYQLMQEKYDELTQLSLFEMFP